MGYVIGFISFTVVGILLLKIRQRLKKGVQQNDEQKRDAVAGFRHTHLRSYLLEEAVAKAIKGLIQFFEQQPEPSELVRRNLNLSFAHRGFTGKVTFWAKTGHLQVEMMIPGELALPEDLLICSSPRAIPLTAELPEPSGDAFFDARLLFGCQPRIKAACLLNRDIRRDLLALVEPLLQLCFVKRTLRFLLVFPPVSSRPEVLAESVKASMDLFRRLAVSPDLRASLMRNFDSVEPADVREKNFRFFLADYGDEPGLRSFLYTMLLDPQFSLNRLALEKLGEAGWRHLNFLVVNQGIMQYNPEIQKNVISLLLLQESQECRRALQSYFSQSVAREMKVDLLHGLLEKRSAGAQAFFIDFLPSADFIFAREILTGLEKYGDNQAPERLLVNLSTQFPDFKPELLPFFYRTISRLSARLHNECADSLPLAENKLAGGPSGLGQECPEGSLVVGHEHPGGSLPVGREHPDGLFSTAGGRREFSLPEKEHE